MLIELQGKTSTRLHSATMNKQPQIRLKSLRDVKVAVAGKEIYPCKKRCEQSCRTFSIEDG